MGFAVCLFFSPVFSCGCAGSALLRGLLSGCGVQASHCSGFSGCRAQVLGTDSVAAARGQ